MLYRYTADRYIHVATNELMDIIIIRYFTLHLLYVAPVSCFKAGCFFYKEKAYKSADNFHECNIVANNIVQCD
ncbi:MAG: hypothetical protein EA393_04960 [Bacteroidetes bacterium]|nr:MAG: hypothetical protein EA393_04960 [Bacteroidota bacterium]